jgi:uncharacterized integral membrane protein
MGFAYILVAILSAAVAVFALQNNTPLSVRFLGWTLPEVPLAGAILASLITGMVVTAIPLMISRWSWRRRARALETKVDMLEAELSAREARETALLTPRPATPPPTPPRVQSA